MSARPDTSSTSTITHQVTDARAWTRDTLAPSDWTIALGPESLREIDAFVAYSQRHPIPTQLLAPQEHQLQSCARQMSEVKRRLDAGPGVVVVDRLPIENWSRKTCEDVFWLLGAMVDRPVVQTIDGQVLVEVTDTGVKKRIGVRGFRTNAGQRAHVDNAFNLTPPDYVSLLSLRKSLEGGRSEFISFYTVHNVLLERYPEELARLYQPFYQDRQGDYWPDEPQTVNFPIFALDPDLRSRFSHFTIPAGYKSAGVEMDAAAQKAFDAITEVVSDPSLYCDFTIEPGQLQFVNNRFCGHGRTAYTDHSDPARKRLLLRLWHRAWGRRSYSG
ncbi:MAG: TauD/TfdA family dioxygenase [Gammaproteobacteria bacterium]|nr:TauD/TfdA family dioxygenase [Gammaproteobacteria bacterium]